MNGHKHERWMEHAWDMRSHGNHDACVDALKRILAEDPEHPSAHALLALVLLDMKRLYAAEIEAQTAISLDPLEPITQCAMAAVLMARRKLQRAGEHVKALLALAPHEPGNYRLAAQLCVLENRANDAQPFLDQALELDPNDPDTLVALAELAESDGRYAEATELCEDALAEDPEHIDANVLRGRLHLRQGEVEDARRRALFVLSDNAEDTPALYLLAAIKAQESRLWGMWWRLNSVCDRLTETQIMAALLGSFVLYRLAVIIADHFHLDALSSVFAFVWLGFCAYTWIAPGMFRRSLAQDLNQVELSDDF